MDLSTVSGTPAAAAAAPPPEHPAGLIADDAVKAAPSDAAVSRSAHVAPASTVASSVHALRASAAQVRGSHNAFKSVEPCSTMLTMQSYFYCLQVCSALLHNARNAKLLWID